MNLFDQIAICDIMVEGEILPTSEYKNLDINILDSLDTSEDEEQEVSNREGKELSGSNNSSPTTAL